MPINAEKWKQKNPHKVWASSTLSYHRKKGYSIIVTINDLTRKAEKAMYCALCGTKLNWVRGTKRTATSNSPSLDRKNNGNKITSSTILIVCHKCNTMKQDKTIIEYKQYIEQIYPRLCELVEQES